MLLQGKERIVWNGLWRKGTRDKIVDFVKNYENYAPTIKRYIEIHDIFLAPLTVARRKRQLIEGNIAKIIKGQKPPISNLLPSDIRYVCNRKKQKKDLLFILNMMRTYLDYPKFLKFKSLNNGHAAPLRFVQLLGYKF